MGVYQRFNKLLDEHKVVVEELEQLRSLVKRQAEQIAGLQEQVTELEDNADALLNEYQETRKDETNGIEINRWSMDQTGQKR